MKKFVIPAVITAALAGIAAVVTMIVRGIKAVEEESLTGGF